MELRAGRSQLPMMLGVFMFALSLLTYLNPTASSFRMSSLYNNNSGSNATSKAGTLHHASTKTTLISTSHSSHSTYADADTDDTDDTDDTEDAPPDVDDDEDDQDDASAYPTWLVWTSTSASKIGRRDMIRATWQRYYGSIPGLTTKFVIGTPTAEWAPLIAAENATYGDILILDTGHDDHAFAVTQKTFLLMSYLVDTPGQRYDFVSKTDDDTFVNARAFWENFVVPYRHAKGKIFARVRQHRREHPFPDGAFYTLTWDVVEMEARLYKEKPLSGLEAELDIDWTQPNVLIPDIEEGGGEEGEEEESEKEEGKKEEETEGKEGKQYGALKEATESKQEEGDKAGDEGKDGEKASTDDKDKSKSDDNKNDNNSDSTDNDASKQSSSSKRDDSSSTTTPAIRPRSLRKRHEDYYVAHLLVAEGHTDIEYIRLGERESFDVHINDVQAETIIAHYCKKDEHYLWVSMMFDEDGWKGQVQGGVNWNDRIRNDTERGPGGAKAQG